MPRMCPACGKEVSDDHFACQFARKGGKATGGKKARTSAQMAQVARARWDKARKEQADVKEEVKA